MAKEKDQIIEDVSEAVSTPTTGNKEASLTKITPEMLSAIQSLLGERDKKAGTDGLSLYTDVRDPLKVEEVRVKRFDNQFVVGYKNLNTDSYSSTPIYTVNKAYPDRKLNAEPHITLLLADGTEDANGLVITEKEVALIDYMTYRTEVILPVIEFKAVEDIIDKGRLGVRGGAFETDGSGNPVARLSVKKEVRMVDYFVTVQPKDFAKPISINQLFLA